jgi:DNA-binding beta-propeller fold protein YncE
VIEIVDTSTRKKIGEIKVDSANIEAMAIEKDGPRIFANIRDKSMVGVIDREKKTVTATWPLGELHGNTPLIFDQANHRIFVAGRKPPSLEVLDSESGKIIATLPTAEMTDDMAFDPGGKRIYVACTEFAAVYKKMRIITKTSAGFRRDSVQRRPLLSLSLNAITSLRRVTDKTQPVSKFTKSSKQELEKSLWSGGRPIPLISRS